MIKLSKFILKKLTSQYNISALPALLICSLLMSEHVIAADNFQSSGWQCRSTDNEQWDCSPALDNNSELTAKDDNSSINTNPVIESDIAVKSAPIVAFPEADFSNQKSGRTNSLEKQTTDTSRSPVMNPMWASCAVQMDNAQYSQSLTPSTNQVDSDETNIEADAAESPDSSQINFTGNVVITQKEQQLIADKVNYNKTSRIFDAQGNVTIADPNLILKGDSARYQADDKKGRIENASYQLPSRPAQGVASSMQFKPGKISSEDITYSTCPVGDQDWVLSASSMDFYTDEGYGEGTHAVMRFKGIPIAYTPYIRFPLNNERQSGFLMPSFGNTDSSGFEVATPYYFNIAPNQDATVTPKYFSDRGFMLGGEYRYLTETYSGEFYAEGLRDDSYDDKRDASEVLLREGLITTDSKIKPRDISKNRGAFSIQQHANWKNGWSGKVDYNYVSDNYYLEDFGNNLRDKSESHLLREGQINYNGSIFDFMIKTQGYQELIATGHTYSRLPQITLSANDSYNIKGFDINAGFDSEFVMFAQNWDDRNLIQGDRLETSRLHLKPSISIPFKNSYGFIIPKFSVDMVTYELDNENRNIWDDDSPSRATPIFSLDSGLFFDKDLSLFDTAMKQTLEPRLFYLNIPEDNQEDMPLFDTGLNTFNYNQLFRENRFNGIDRLGDANQLTAGLTTRFIDQESGAERLKASIGQIYYFDDREVLLNYNDPVEEEYNKNSSSSIAAEVSSQFMDNWYTGYSLLYNPHDGGNVEESRYRLQYKADPYHLVNFDYTYSQPNTKNIFDEIGDTQYEQVEISTYWEVAPQWRVLAHWYYSINDNSIQQEINDRLQDDKNNGFTLESKLGIEYDSCCYAVRLVIGRDQKDYYSDGENSIMLQFQFKGLGSLAQHTGALSSESLTDSIPGFEDWKN